MEIRSGVIFLYDVVGSTEAIMALDSIQQQVFYDSLEASSNAVVLELATSGVTKVKYTGDGHFFFADRASMCLDLYVYLSQAVRSISFLGRSLRIRCGNIWRNPVHNTCGQTYSDNCICICSIAYDCNIRRECYKYRGGTCNSTRCMLEHLFRSGRHRASHF